MLFLGADCEISYSDIEQLMFAKEKYKDGFPKPPFLAKKSRRGIRAYLESDLQWYHQKRNALEVLETFQLMQEEEGQN